MSDPVTTDTLLALIAARRTRRADVATLYREALSAPSISLIDWRMVNAAIVSRWSPHALHWIKQEAWRDIKPCREIEAA